MPILFFSAFLYSVGINFFYVNSRAFQTGIGAYSQMFVFLYEIPQRYYFLLYFGMNIPLLIFFSFKLRKQFVLYTLVWLTFQLLWGQILSLQVVQNEFNNIFEGDMQGNFFVPSIRVLYGVAGTFVIATSIGITFLAGGCTGGTDFFVQYFSTKYQKSIGFYAIIFAIVTAFSSVFIQYFFGQDPEKNYAELFFGITTFTTLFYIFAGGLIINFICPRLRKVKVEIHTNKKTEVLAMFKREKHPHGYIYHVERSGFSNKDRTIVTTVIFYVNLVKTLRQIKNADPEAWICVSFVHRVFGRFAQVF